MSELTDLEICDQLAKIKGLDVEYNNGRYFYKTIWGLKVFNPLTDDALCFRLMVKYEVQLYAEDPEFNVAQCNSWAELYPRHSSVNKAICLAIIESHKGQ